MDVLINIDVDDLERAEVFYTNALGLRPARRFGSAGVELVGASSKLYLLAKEEGSPAWRGEDAPRRAYARHWTPVHLDFVTDDLDAAVERACRVGARLEEPARESAWGRIALLADPFGHGFCLIEFSERGYDAIAT